MFTPTTEKSEPSGVLYEWHMGALDFKRYDFLLTEIDDLITAVRFNPSIELFKLLYSHLKTFYNNVRAAVVTNLSEDVRKYLLESGFIKAEVLDKIKLKREYLDYIFDYLFTTLNNISKNYTTDDKAIKAGAFTKQFMDLFDFIHQELLYTKDSIGLSAPKRFKRSLRAEIEGE